MPIDSLAVEPAVFQLPTRVTESDATTPIVFHNIDSLTVFEMLHGMGVLVLVKEEVAKNLPARISLEREPPDRFSKSQQRTFTFPTGDYEVEVLADDKPGPSSMEGSEPQWTSPAQAGRPTPELKLDQPSPYPFTVWSQVFSLPE